MRITDVVGYLGSLFGLYPLGGTTGGVVVRQRGGTAGTSEVQVSHDGTQTTVESKAGKVRITGPTTPLVVGQNGADSYTFDTNGLKLAANFFIRFGTSFSNSPAVTSPATGVLRVGVSEGVGAGTFASIPLSPTQITADTNNYAPGVAWFYRLSTDAARTLTGLSVSQVDGQMAEVWNVGSNNIVLTNQSASSTAANRFICTGGADITLAADEVALLRYDATTARWRVRKV